MLVFSVFHCDKKKVWLISVRTMKSPSFLSWMPEYNKQNKKQNKENQKANKTKTHLAHTCWVEGQAYVLA